MKKCFWVLVLVLALGSVGCESKSEEPGVVARVNGRPIYLHQLEFMNGLEHAYGEDDYNPTVEQLRSEYGEALSKLITLQLIMQELDRRGLAVTDEDLAEAEKQIREDYPEGVFEEVLTEEYIDLNAWKEMLRARLSEEKFVEFVLRPGIKLDYREAENYYKTHISDFILPPRVTLLHISGPSRDLVEKASGLVDSGEEPESISSKFKEVAVRKFKMREDRLPSGWRETVSGLKKGGKSQVFAEQSLFQRLVLLDRTPGKVVEPSQAYPIVENILLERKIAEAFGSWVERAVGEAELKVSVYLKELENLGETAEK